jgi:hypothetical protein
MTIEGLERGIQLQHLIKECDEYIIRCEVLRKTDELFLASNTTGCGATLYFENEDKEEIIDFAVNKKRKEKAKYEEEFVQL